MEYGDDDEVGGGFVLGVAASIIADDVIFINDQHNQEQRQHPELCLLTMDALKEVSSAQRLEPIPCQLSWTVGADC